MPPSIDYKIAVPLLSAAAFGLYPACAKLAYQHGANPSFVVIATTFARAAALILFCFASGRSWLPAAAERPAVFSGGFLQALSVFAIISSLVYLPAPVTVTLLFTHTILLLLFMALRGEERLTPAVLITTLTALLGVSFVVDLWHQAGEVRWEGIALALLASVATMSRLYVFGKQVTRDHPAVVGARIFGAAALFSLLLIPFSAPAAPATAGGWGALIFCCLSLVLGTFGLFYGIALAGPFRFSLMVKLEPVFTAIFSWIILGELLHGLQYLGIATVIASLAAYQLYGATEAESAGAA